MPTPQRQLANLEEMVHGFEFTRVLDIYRAASTQGDDEMKSHAVKWLRGEYRTKTEARAELGMSAIIDDDTWYDYIKLFARFLTGAGYRGMLVLIDELVNLYKIANAITRQYNYEKILQMYNDTLQGKAQHLGIIMGGTPTSIEDRRRGVFSYEALRSRLTQGRFAREGMRDMLAPIIRLQPLTYEELLVLIEKLAQIHAGYFGYEFDLDEGDLVDFLKIEFGRVGADTHLTPREVIRDFIELLDIMCQNPDVTLKDLLAGEAEGAAGLRRASQPPRPAQPPPRAPLLTPSSPSSPSRRMPRHLQKQRTCDGLRLHSRDGALHAQQDEHDAHAKHDMAKAGNAGIRRIHTVSKLNAEHLRNATHHEHRRGGVETDMVRRDGAAQLGISDVQGVLKQHKQEENDHAQRKVMGVDEREGRCALETIELGELTEEHASHHGENRVNQSAVGVLLHASSFQSHLIVSYSIAYSA